MKNNQLIFKNSHIFLILFAAGLVSLAVYAKDYATEEAAQRAQNVIQQVQTPKNPNVPESSLKNPVVGDDLAEGYKVPEVPQYGNSNQAADPLVVAQRYKERVYDPTLKKNTDLLVFVSFSMPEASLMRIASEAKKTGAIMVLRGFKDGSFKKTVAATRLINGLGAQVMVHPDLFLTYKVTDVPTFVLADANPEQGGCDQLDECNVYYSVKGDVGLGSVLENFEKRKDSQKLTDSATTRLTALQTNAFYGEKGQ